MLEKEAITATSVLTPAVRNPIPMSHYMRTRRLVYLAPNTRTIITTRADLVGPPTESVQIHDIRHATAQVLKRPLLVELLLMLHIITVGRRPRKVEHLEIRRVQYDVHIARHGGWRVAL